MRERAVHPVHSPVQIVYRDGLRMGTRTVAGGALDRLAWGATQADTKRRQGHTRPTLQTRATRVRRDITKRVPDNTSARHVRMGVTQMHREVPRTSAKRVKPASSRTVPTQCCSRGHAHPVYPASIKIRRVKPRANPVKQAKQRMHTAGLNVARVPAANIRPSPVKHHVQTVRADTTSVTMVTAPVAQPAPPVATWTKKERRAGARGTPTLAPIHVCHVHHTENHGVGITRRRNKLKLAINMQTMDTGARRVQAFVSTLFKEERTIENIAIGPRVTRAWHNRGTKPPTDSTLEPEFNVFHFLFELRVYPSSLPLFRCATSTYRVR